MFSLASLVQVQQHAAKLTAHQSFWTKISDKFRQPLTHKRGQEELYEGTQTPFNSPEKTARGTEPTQGGAPAVEPEAERKTVAESPAIEERSPSPPRTAETGLESAGPIQAAAPTRAASSIEAEERKEPSGPKVQPVVASLSTVDNQRKCVLAKVSARCEWRTARVCCACAADLTPSLALLCSICSFITGFA